MLSLGKGYRLPRGTLHLFAGMDSLHTPNALEEDLPLGKPHAPGDLAAGDTDGIPALLQEDQFQEAVTCFAGKTTLAQLFHKGDQGIIGILSNKGRQATGQDEARDG